MKKSSISLQQLCGDINLSIFDKIKYILLNYENNKLKQTEIDCRIKFINYKPKSISLESKLSCQAPVTPPRFLCNEFWDDFDLSQLIKSNGPLRILEVGCGTGVYGLELQRKLGDNMALYRGVDIVRQSSWSNMPEKFEFHVDKAENIAAYLADIDLIVTQSAIEHFEYDITFFEHISDYTRNINKNIWQIHLMPSEACLTTYLWHGYRQYNPHSLSKISLLFVDASEINVYRLGGFSTNALHRLFITIPNLLLRNDFRTYFPKWYCRALVKSVEKDMVRADNFSASFYSLVIKSDKG